MKKRLIPVLVLMLACMFGLGVQAAGLIKNVAVVGCNNHAEIWDSDTWAEINNIETSSKNIAAVMEELDF